MPRPKKFTSFASEIVNNADINSEGVDALMQAYWDENSCALCNHAHCMCSKKTEGLNASQKAIDSISRLMSTSPYLGALLGREFEYDNPSSKVLAMNVLFGSPLVGFDNTTDGEPEVGGGHMGLVSRHFLRQGIFKCVQYEWALAMDGHVCSFINIENIIVCAQSLVQGFFTVEGKQTKRFKQWALRILKELQAFESEDFDILYIWITLFFDIMCVKLYFRPTSVITPVV